MKKIMYIIIIILVLIIAWSLFSYFFGRSIAEPGYKVLEKRDGYEIRLYEPYITAQVEIEGSYDTAINQGFRILADYIFGNNTKQAGIKMTAPVSEKKSEKMAMTAPVLVKDNEVLSMTAPVIENASGTKRTISFVMPFEYTLETLPKPNNSDIKFKEIDSRKMAVSRYSFYSSGNRAARKKEELLKLLNQDKVKTKGTPEYAGYNAPFNAPWLNRHEVMIEVE